MSDRSIIDKLINEFVKRHRAGEQPTLEEYCEKHPQLADEIRELLPMILLVEDVNLESETLFDERAEFQNDEIQNDEF